MKPEIAWDEIAALIAADGPFISAAADISDLHRHFRFGGGVRLEEMTHAVSMAYPLSEAVVEEIEDFPTVLYKHHYRNVNMLLDRCATRVAAFIQSRGGRALPVPASVFVDWKTQAAHLSHKMIAVRAGIGWIGRHVLLTTPEYGARVRLVTVLTDAPIKSPSRLKAECGACNRCVSACPVGAINSGPHDFDLLSCHNQNRYFEKHGMSVRICGICVKACRAGIRMRDEG